MGQGFLFQCYTAVGQLRETQVYLDPLLCNDVVFSSLGKSYLVVRVALGVQLVLVVLVVQEETVLLHLCPPFHLFLLSDPCLHEALQCGDLTYRNVWLFNLNTVSFTFLCLLKK